MVTHIFFVRSAETIWHQQDRLLGRRDLGLTQAGIEQTRQALGRLKHLEITEILSSPLSRAIQTAEIFAHHYRLGIGRDPRLVEVDLGEWEGCLAGEVSAKPEFQSLASGGLENFPQGESLSMAQKRGVSSLEEAIADNPHSANIVIISHLFLMRLILAYYLKLPKEQLLNRVIRNSSISIIQINAETGLSEILSVDQDEVVSIV